MSRPPSTARTLEVRREIDGGRRLGIFPGKCSARFLLDPQVPVEGILRHYAVIDASFRLEQTGPLTHLTACQPNLFLIMRWALLTDIFLAKQILTDLSAAGSFEHARMQLVNTPAWIVDSGGRSILISHYGR